MKIGYCRKSKDKQDLTTQINLVMKAGVSPDNIFSDSESGATEAKSRSGFIALRERIKRGDITELIVTEFSRIGRDTWDTIGEMSALVRDNIKLTSLAENEKFISDSPRETQPLMIAAMSMGADIERKHISERTKWALSLIKAGQKQTKKGTPLGRPVKNIDWEKIQKKRAEYNVSTNMARVLCQYKKSTFYAAKRELKVKDPERYNQIFQTKEQPVKG